MRAHVRLSSIIVVFFVALDQYTKYLVRANLRMRERIEVIPGFFNLTHLENPGAAWGILGDNEYRLVFFTVITLVAFIVLIGYFRQLKPDERTMACALSLIFAGALGNFIDRLSPRHTVTDFLDFYASGAAAPIVRKLIGSAHWPAWNVADGCISVGVTLFIIHILFLENRTPNPEDKDAPAPLTPDAQEASEPAES